MRKIYLLIIINCLCSCAINNKNSAYDVAKYNYMYLSSTQSSSNRYLLTNKKGKTSIKNIKIYLNNTKKDYMINSMTIKYLMEYNKKIMENYNENKNI